MYIFVFVYVYVCMYVCREVLVELDSVLLLLYSSVYTSFFSVCQEVFYSALQHARQF